MNDSDFNDDQGGFFERNGIAIGVGAAFLIIGGVVVTLFLLYGKTASPHKPAEIMVRLLPPPPLPPPPPPPPPPKIPPPPQPKMVEQPPIKPNEVKPKALAKTDKPPGPPGPKASGPPSNDGIGGNGGGGDGTGGDESGSRFGWYGAQIQDAVHQALDQNATTRHASVHHLRIRIWIDSTGRISRTVLSGSSGDSSVDSALKDQAFNNVQLSQPPPSDMPMPVVLNIDEQRPN